MFSGITPTDLVIVILSILFSMGIHEAMHAFTSHWLGDDTAYHEGRLTLNPLKHIDLVTTVILPVILISIGAPPIFAAKPVPFNPEYLKYDEFGMALVGLAGPLTNFVLAGAAALIFRGIQPDPSSLLYNVLLIFTEVNIGFFIFNMIPFPPLDGSRLLYAFAPEPLQEIMRQIEGFGFMGILIFFFFIFQFISGPVVQIENTILRWLL